MIRTTKLALIVVTATVFLASCASIYEPPASGSLARVKFQGNHYFAYVDEGNSCDTRKLVLKDLWSGTHVRAGKRVWIEQGIDTSGTPMGYICKLAMSFEPQEDTTYVSEYSNANMRCTLRLYRLKADGTLERDTTVQAERTKACMF